MPHRFLLRLLPTVMSVAVLLGLPSEGESKTLYRWVQLGSEGPSARAITDDDTCPTLMVDGIALPMTTRSDPKQVLAHVPVAQFAVRSCERIIPTGTVVAMLEGAVLPLPRPNPSRILIIGDTGCRLKKGDPVQDCNSDEGWPFPHLAASAAASRPDLVIHVGDYHYRETACPADHSGCQGSPSGYGWDAWAEDFFKPASPLFAVAPWILTRGNHEDCARAGEGWWRFLDAEPPKEACVDLSGSFMTRLGEFGVVVVDGANASDPKGDGGALADKLARQFVLSTDRLPQEVWLATHRPVNAMRGSKGKLVVENRVEQQALGPLMPEAVSMIVSGHIHFFQALDFGGARPAQLVAGMSGDNLEPMVPMPVTGEIINGATVTHATTRSAFGYVVLDRMGPGMWLGVVFDDRGKPVEHCRLERRSLTCG